MPSVVQVFVHAVRTEGRPKQVPAWHGSYPRVIRTTKFCNVYRKFALSFSCLTAPLDRELRKGEPTRFEPDATEHDAVNKLKDKLITPPALPQPPNGEQYPVKTDACDTQVGVVLFQKQTHKILNLIGFRPSTLCHAETRYGTTHKKCLAVELAILQLNQ